VSYGFERLSQQLSPWLPTSIDLVDLLPNEKSSSPTKKASQDTCVSCGPFELLDTREIDSIIWLLKTVLSFESIALVLSDSNARISSCQSLFQKIFYLRRKPAKPTKAKPIKHTVAGSGTMT
jgi:hypothetical protein